MRHVAAMQVQVVRRAVYRFKDREIFLIQLRVPRRSRVDRKEKGQVGIVGVECPLLAEIELPIAWDRGEEGIEQVVAFLIQQSVMLRE
jgi:hypothetical protein